MTVIRKNMKIIIKYILNFPNFLYNFINLKMKSVYKENNITINGRMEVHNCGKIYIGNNTSINSAMHYNPIGFETKTILFTGENATIKIGENVGISNSVLFAMKEIIIGNNVKIGGGCKIYDTDFHSLKYEDRIDKVLDNQNAKNAKVLIMEGAFLGAGVIILKGVTIGEKSIIGACSVVTKDVPDGEIWCGNPAKFVRKV